MVCLLLPLRKLGPSEALRKPAHVNGRAGVHVGGRRAEHKQSKLSKGRIGQQALDDKSRSKMWSLAYTPCDDEEECIEEPISEQPPAPEEDMAVGDAQVGSVRYLTPSSTRTRAH